MKDIAIYGAGGFGREIACLIREINEQTDIPTWKLVGFFDDGKPIGDNNEYGTVLGGYNELNVFPKPLSVVMAIGRPSTLVYLISKINNPLIDYPNIIAPDLRVLDKNNLSMGFGNIFFSKCSLSCNVSIGNFNIFNGSIAVGHDVVIGNFNTFMPGARISGEVKLGDRNLMGVYAVILQQNTIGNDTIIGSGSVMMRSTKGNGTYVGNPAKKMNF